MTDIVERLRMELNQEIDAHNKTRAEIERLRGIEWFVAEAARHERDGLRAEIERLTADRTKLIALLAEARGPQGETEERVAEWLRGRGYICALEPKPTYTAANGEEGWRHDISGNEGRS